MIIDPRQPGEMAEAHRRASRSRPAASASRLSTRARNVAPVLSIGQTEFIHFRGRAFGVPPLPWPAGEALTDAHVTAVEAMGVLAINAKDRDAIRQYYGALPRIAALLWANCTPTGKVARFVKRIPLLRGILRNPFSRASDAELLEYSDFFLARRMRSGVRLHPAAANPDRRTS